MWRTMNQVIKTCRRRKVDVPFDRMMWRHCNWNRWYGIHVPWWGTEIVSKHWWCWDLFERIRSLILFHVLFVMNVMNGMVMIMVNNNIIFTFDHVMVIGKWWCHDWYFLTVFCDWWLQLVTRISSILYFGMYLNWLWHGYLNLWSSIFDQNQESSILKCKIIFCYIITLWIQKSLFNGYFRRYLYHSSSILQYEHVHSTSSKSSSICLRKGSTELWCTIRVSSFSVSSTGTFFFWIFSSYEHTTCSFPFIPVLLNIHSCERSTNSWQQRVVAMVEVVGTSIDLFLLLPSFDTLPLLFSHSSLQISQPPSSLVIILASRRYIYLIRSRTSNSFQGMRSVSWNGTSKNKEWIRKINFWFLGIV